MPAQQDWVPASVDVSVPSVARMYDYLLGGAHNFAIDREVGAKVEKVAPHARTMTRINRALLGRFVRYMVNHGVRQFLDIGSGIPTVANVHEVAQAANPECRVVYVDRDPVASAHSELILAGNDYAGVVQADLRDPDSILGSSAVRRLLDFDEPVGLLMLLVLHWVPDGDDPWKLVARFRDALPSASYLAITHLTSDDISDSTKAATGAYNASGPEQVIARSGEQIAEFFGDFELVEPGMVPYAEWRPSGPGDISDVPEINRVAYAGMARKP